MINEDLSKLLAKCDKVQSILYTTEYSDFDNFTTMENYLQSADKSLSEKIDELNRRKDLIHDQFITASSVYQINNKKRQKEQQLLRIEREKIKKQLEIQASRLAITIHPMTTTLKQKKYQLEKLKQSKQIVQDFNKLVRGNQQETSKLLLFDQKNFKNSALKIYVFKTLLEDINNQQYLQAKIRVNKKYSQLKNKILLNFKEGFWKNDQRLIINALPYCQQYELLDEVSDFYNEQAFREVHKISKITQSQATSEIKNLFFLIQRGIKYAFAINVDDTGQRNNYQISVIFGSYSEAVARRFITFVFEKLIKQSIENVLKQAYNSNAYLNYLEVFFNECKFLLKVSEQIITYEKINHLMSTYFQSIFDVYLDSYLHKQINNISTTFEQCIQQIMTQIKATEPIRNQQMVSSNKKFSIKDLFTNYKIDTKNDLSGQQIQGKIKGLLNTFMNPALETIFDTIKKSLQRNNKIAKLNQIDRNRNEIMSVFVKDLGDLIQYLIKEIGQIIPKLDEKSAVHQDFFQILPHVTLVLQRMELIYEQFRKEAKYQLTQGMKLQQKKQTLLSSCQKSLNKIVAQALASILGYENNILKSDEKLYYLPTSKNQLISEPCAKVTSLLEKYLKSYKASIMKSIGIQFFNLLIDHYSSILYSKDGLGKIFLDIANYKKLVTIINSPQIQNKYKVLRSLIDIYVIKNQDKTINNYIKDQKQTNLKLEKQQTIKSYVNNKKKNQKE